MGQRQSKQAGSPTGSIFIQNRVYDDGESLFPTDGMEIDRQHAQSFVLKEAFGGAILPGANISLEKGFSVLDDLATDYPDVKCTGVGATNTCFPSTIRPKNVSFKTADVLQGLPFDDESFDFVQMRLHIPKLRVDEWSRAIKEVARVTKHGGYIQMIEPNIRIATTDEIAKEIMSKLHSLMVEIKHDPNIFPKIPKLLDQAGAELASQKIASIPIGWKNKTGDLMLENLRQGLLATKLVVAPIFELDGDEYVNLVDDLVGRLQASKAAMNFYGFLGRKRCADKN
ncbi:hypothetical protein BC936DRAFT_150175 [Jimgerdemannia flammicorona]|uniref:Methyltransferase type 11 domain-containing protein n=1 Tax=Jimgerdemannia flammicorona TaxID=994334 RepID=A0A433DJT2_9FUNG|nr:hypothetical protein BC936DRAFT_150175 [Jimgerdemannia flammicorona]